MTREMREFLLRCPVTLGSHDSAWDVVTALQKAGFARLEWVGTRVARVWWTEAGNQALQQSEG